MSKALLISGYYLDESHGSEPMTAFNLIEQSLEMQFKTIVLTSNLTDTKLIQNLEQKYGKMIEVHIIPKAFGKLWISRLLFYPIYRNWQKRTGRYLVRNNVDYDLGIHASLSTFLFGSGLSYTSKPYVFGPAGFSFFDIKFSVAFGKRSFLELIRNLFVYLLLLFDPFVRRSLRKATKVLCGDQKVIDVLNSVYLKHNLHGSPIAHAIIPPAQNFFLDIEKDQKRIVWVGRFIPRKDPLFAIESFKKILSGDQTFKLTLIGKGPLESKLRKFVKENNLEEYVEFSGWLEKAEVMRKMRHSALMMFTSFRESAGVQLFEANSVRTRVVALSATGASKWYRSDLISFVVPTRLESRYSLIDKFTKECQLHLDSPTKGNEIWDWPFSKKNLLGDILSTLD